MIRILLLFLLLLAPTPVRAADFDTQVRGWERTLDRLSTTLAQPALAPPELAAAAGALAAVRTGAAVVRGDAERALAALKLVLDALGPGPAADAAPEPPALSQQRAALARTIAEQDARRVRSQALLVRVEQVQDALSAAERRALSERLLRPGPSLLEAESWRYAVAGLTAPSAQVLLVVALLVLVTVHPLALWVAFLPVAGVVVALEQPWLVGAILFVALLQLLARRADGFADPRALRLRLRAFTLGLAFALLPASLLVTASPATAALAWCALVLALAPALTLLDPRLWGRVPVLLLGPMAVTGLSLPASLAAGVLGYPDLARHLLAGGVLTLAICAAHVVARRLLRHAWPPRPGVVPSLLRLALEGVLLLGAVALVLVAWDIPVSDLERIARATLIGIDVGGVRIAPVAIVTALAVFAFVAVATRMVQAAVLRGAEQAALQPEMRHAIGSAVGYAGVVLAIVAALAVAGLDVTQIALFMGALTVAVGFGLRGLMMSLVAGVVVAVERPFRVDDWIHLGAVEGRIRRITLRTTEVETAAGGIVLVPNGDVLAQPVVNLTRLHGPGRVEVRIGIAYDNDLDRALQMAATAAAEVPGVQGPGSAYVHRFADTVVEIDVRVSGDPARPMAAMRSDVAAAVHGALRRGGIVLRPGQAPAAAAAPDAPPPEA